MQHPLNKILSKIFVLGFYRAHAGILAVGFFVMFGLVEPSQLLNYHKTLMLAFVSSPLMMAAVFTGWLLYAAKSAHYIMGQIAGVNQQFLFYSSNAFDKKEQLKSWAHIQMAVLLPIIIYGGVAAGVGIAHHFYIMPFAVIVYLCLLTALCAVLYTRTINKLVDGGKQSRLLRLTGNWQKPWFSLFIYHISDKQKLNWLITKGISWVLITGVFYLFADVAHDLRVAGIAILAVITAHTRLIFELRSFEEKWLSFARNLPYTRGLLFLNFVAVYLVLLLPETVWLFSRFSPFIAGELLLAGLSFAMLFHCLLYWLGLNMDKYLTWILGLFMLLFWVVMFKLLLLLAILTFAIAFLIFYRNYYGEWSGVSGE